MKCFLKHVGFTKENLTKGGLVMKNYFYKKRIRFYERVVGTYNQELDKYRKAYGYSDAEARTTFKNYLYVKANKLSNFLLVMGFIMLLVLIILK